MAEEVSLLVWLVWEPRRGRQVLPVSDAVVVGHCIAHPLEGVAAVAEVLGAVGKEFEFAGLDLGAVLLVLEVADAGEEAIG